MRTIHYTTHLALVCAATLFALTLASACKTVPVNSDSVYGAVVDCAKVNPQASAALASVETCLVGAMAQDYSACLTGLVTGGHFVIDEVACVVAWYAQQPQAKQLQQHAKASAPTDVTVSSHAKAWLSSEAISIRNPYR
jgi:hypothetical protein